MFNQPIFMLYYFLLLLSILVSSKKTFNPTSQYPFLFYCSQLKLEVPLLFDDVLV